MPPNVQNEHLSLSAHASDQLWLCAAPVGRMYARPVVHNARTPNAAGGKTATAAPPSKAGKASSSGAAGASSSKQGTGAGSSNGASSSSSAGAAAGTSSAASSSRGRQDADNRPEPAASVAPWLDEQYCGYEDDDDDFTIYESDSYSRGGAGSSRQADRSCSNSSRSRARMIKPVRQVPKGAAVSPAVASAACPVVNTPMGRSPGNGGFHVGSWGVAGKSPNSCGGMWAAAGAGSAGTPGTSSSSSQVAGSAPGSGRRARRNARRAAMDAGDDD